MGFGRGYVWPDTVGTPTDPDTAFATVGPGIDIEVGLENELVLELICTAGVPRAWEAYVEVDLGAGGAWMPWSQQATQCSAGATDIAGIPVIVPQNCTARISFRRWGGNVNTALAVFAVARLSMPEPSFHEQPLQLVNSQQDGVECFGTGAGAAAAPAATPNYAPEPAAAATQLRIPTGVADTLVIEATVGTLAATTIEFVIQESTDDGTTFWPLMAVNSVVAGVVSQTLAQEQISGALGTRSTREITVKPGTLIRVDAQRTGGGAGTTLLAYARFYRRGV